MNDFENLLQHLNASEEVAPRQFVWENIREKLHGKRKWPFLTILTSFVLLLHLGAAFLYEPPTKLFNEPYKFGHVFYYRAGQPQPVHATNKKPAIHPRNAMTHTKTTTAFLFSLERNNGPFFI